MNELIASGVLEFLKSNKVSHCVVCPGGRNATFIKALKLDDSFKKYSFFDERAAAFFALGLAKKNSEPVAVFTTSGTAVAELMPAIIEAHYKRVPLIVVTADRPSRMRQTGGPQCIEQLGFFGSYVQNSVDVETQGDLKKLSFALSNPQHINVCFDENAVIESPKGKSFKSFEEFVLFAQKPLLLVGESYSDLSENLILKISKLKIPVFLEASELSYAKFSNVIRGGEATLLWGAKNQIYDSIIRIGGVPTNKIWREAEIHKIPTFSFSEFPFAGLSHGGFEECSFAEGLETIEKKNLNWNYSSLIKKDESTFASLTGLVEKYPLSEVSEIKNIVNQVSGEDLVYLGNSLPIREWNLVGKSKVRKVFANRGANGIDGQLSTALGMTEEGSVLWVVLGDLTLLYDINGFWAKNYTQGKVNVICINNGGGKIFESLFDDEAFYNSHSYHLKYLARFWGIEFCDSINGMVRSTERVSLLEIKPNNEQSKLFWQEYKALAL